MTVTVVDSHTIRVLNTETEGFGVNFFKTYNFRGYILASRVTASSPEFTWAVKVYDTCAAYYEMVWGSFPNINIDIGSGSGECCGDNLS